MFTSVHTGFVDKMTLSCERNEDIRFIGSVFGRITFGSEMFVTNFTLRIFEIETVWNKLGIEIDAWNIISGIWDVVTDCHGSVVASEDIETSPGHFKLMLVAKEVPFCIYTETPVKFSTTVTIYL